MNRLIVLITLALIVVAGVASANPGQPNFGAVIRMNVRPAAPESGILQFAGGQSGHFLSPHYDDQLGAWASGTPTPFLAGATRYRYTLNPAP